MDRRNFLKGLSAMPAAALAVGRTPASDEPARLAPQPVQGARQRTSKPAGSNRLVGIQIGGRSFVDEGVEKCLPVWCCPASTPK
jgi:hypothetical protein